MESSLLSTIIKIHCNNDCDYTSRMNSQDLVRCKFITATVSAKLVPEENKSLFILCTGPEEPIMLHALRCDI